MTQAQAHLATTSTAAPTVTVRGVQLTKGPSAMGRGPTAARWAASVGIQGIQMENPRITTIRAQMALRLGAPATNTAMPITISAKVIGLKVARFIIGKRGLLLPS